MRTAAGICYRKTGNNSKTFFDLFLMSVDFSYFCHPKKQSSSFWCGFFACGRTVVGSDARRISAGRGKVCGMSLNGWCWRMPK
jgi:hypothetical protein